MKNILVVDDDKITRRVISKVLKPYSKEFNVLTAEDGTDAITAVSTKKIDLVLTDLKMNVMDGFELISYLSKHHVGIPVFAMTAFDDMEAKVNASTVDKVYKKPLDVEKVVEEIRKTLSA